MLARNKWRNPKGEQIQTVSKFLTAHLYFSYKTSYAFIFQKTITLTLCFMIPFEINHQRVTDCLLLILNSGRLTYSKYSNILRKVLFLAFDVCIWTLVLFLATRISSLVASFMIIGYIPSLNPRQAVYEKTLAVELKRLFLLLPYRLKELNQVKWIWKRW